MAYKKNGSGLKRQTIILKRATETEPARGDGRGKVGQSNEPVTRLSERMAIVTMKYGLLGWHGCGLRTLRFGRGPPVTLRIVLVKTRGESLYFCSTGSLIWPLLPQFL